MNAETEMETSDGLGGEPDEPTLATPATDQHNRREFTMGDDLTNERTVPKAIERGRFVFEAYARRDYESEPLNAIRGDLLTDLLHLAEADGENVEKLIEGARTCYLAERDEERLYVFRAEVQVRAVDANAALEKANEVADLVDGCDAGSVFLSGRAPEIHG